MAAGSDLTLASDPDSAVMRKGRWYSSVMVAKYTRGESSGDAAWWLEWTVWAEDCRLLTSAKS